MSSHSGSFLFRSASSARRRQWRGPMPLSIRLCLAGLVAALALAACSTAGTTPGDGTTASAGRNVATSTASAGLNLATPTEASTKAGVKPPAAPTGLHEWVEESKVPVPAHFAWTPPSGPISGYYFWTKGVYVGMTAPPAICGPSWDKLPATAATYTIAEVQANPDAYICAFNAAGTSPTVHFTQNTPVSTPTKAKVKPPAAPTGLHEWVEESKVPVPAHFAWTPPSGPISGYYFWTKGVYVGMTAPPAICGPSWKKLPGTAKTYTIAEVQANPDAYICAFNAAGTSPTVHFTQNTPLP